MFAGLGSSMMARARRREMFSPTLTIVSRMAVCTVVEDEPAGPAATSWGIKGASESSSIDKVVNAAES